MACTNCSLTIKADFEQNARDGGSVLDRFRNLSADEAYFLETFLRCRGIIRDVEARLGISYPTVRARLDSLLNVLSLSDGFVSGSKFTPPAPPPTPVPEETPDPPKENKPSAKDILSKLDSGALDAKAALDALKGN
jgi:hypothetical protein